ncbi:hypothetical protein [Sorangium sp. So ce145]|uniref:hypothetical protein n=1 Tax=Sorangium sp. So ce145 TaxID=3133285 RepID=UPI003F5F82CC
MFAEQEGVSAGTLYSWSRLLGMKRSEYRQLSEKEGPASAGSTRHTLTRWGSRRIRYLSTMYGSDTRGWGRTDARIQRTYASSGRAAQLIAMLARDPESPFLHLPNLQ